MKKTVKILYAICLALLIISASVVRVVSAKSIYYNDIERYEMPAKTGMSEEEIRANYDEMVDFLMRWKGDQLTLPTLPMSEGGKIHFADVKHLFTGFKILLMASLAGAVGCFVVLRKEDRVKSLRGAGIITLALPAAIGIFVAIDWQRFFVLFHKLFFRNDYWIFDARTDPVITILPDGFFLHCLIHMVALVALGAGLCFAAAFVRKKRMADKAKVE